ncbi:hypothetical protein TCE0_033r09342 [Talaromyces pinophilus]|jgi:acetyl esterase/lipase|uniref:BD-FAE-like domain-containing protein n=1 Tax=Talaromyces pinophilus TaxID=128442 RepID=A0A6V8HAU2_TALPI|nr:hypothetical protein TCE0_033r09342 [Talaromyces pinophilus]
MEHLAALGRNIPAMAKPTFQIYGELLNRPESAAAIRSVQLTSHSYGEHEKQNIDLYHRSSVPIPGGKELRPILVFYFGGGFVSGGSTISEIPGGLVYGNVGYFFAEKLGYEVVIPGYRLLGDGAKFPSGAEDVQGALEWLQQHYHTESRDVFILGNSAGGVHVASWLVGGCYFPKKDNLLRQPGGPTLSSIIFLGTPFQWDTQGPLKDILDTYYGGEDEIAKLEPTALMRRTVTRLRPKVVTENENILIVISQFDPEPIETAGRNFLKAWSEEGGKASLITLDGYNHFSPPLALGTGICKEEEWGVNIGHWMMNQLQNEII